MELIALPFALAGFVFATIAFSHATSASAKVDRLEKRLIDSGILDEESASDLLSDSNTLCVGD